MLNLWLKFSIFNRCGESLLIVVNGEKAPIPNQPCSVAKLRQKQLGKQSKKTAA